MQSERLDRAQVALQTGYMKVSSISSGVWSVASHGNQYTVRQDGLNWTCTCPDFANRCQRFGLLCKHIEAVRCLEARPISETGTIDLQNKLNINNTEEFMTQASPSILDLGKKLVVAPPGMDPISGDDVISKLRQPLDMSRVKRRQAPGKGTVPYLEGFDVIDAANELFQFRWSFDLLSEPQVMRWDRIITVYDQKARKKVPVLGENGKPETEVAGIAFLTGKVSLELEGRAFTHADVGRCSFTGDTPEALDMAIAGAATVTVKLPDPVLP